MSTKRIILISGYARSGKDTLANDILWEFVNTKRQAAITKFANALKAALQLALNDVGLGHINVFTEDTREKELLRPLLVEFGKYCRAKDKNVFVNKTIEDVDALLAQGKEAVMISDCRYLNEAHLVRRFGAEHGIGVERVKIGRYGNKPANEEERESIEELNLHDNCEEGWTFPEGDTDGIKAWAKRIAGTNIGKLTGASLEYAKPNKGTEAWIAGNHEPRIHGMDAPDLDALRFGHTHDPKPAPVEQQLKALWDESLAMDEIIDRVSKRVDSAQRNLEGHEQDIGKMQERIEKLEQQVANQNQALNRVANVFDTYLSRNAYYHVLQALEGKANA